MNNRNMFGSTSNRSEENRNEKKRGSKPSKDNRMNDYQEDQLRNEENIRIQMEEQRKIEEYKKWQAQQQQQQQIQLQQRQFAASLQAIFDVIGRTMCSFERYAEKVNTHVEQPTRFTGKYERHKYTIEQQSRNDILEEVKSQLLALQLSLTRYRNTPDVQNAIIKVNQWKIHYLNRDPILDSLLVSLEKCLNGERFLLPETPQIQMTSDALLSTVQEYANSSEKAERETNKFLQDPERKPVFHVDVDHPDEPTMLT